MNGIYNSCGVALSFSIIHALTANEEKAKQISAKQTEGLYEFECIGGRSSAQTNKTIIVMLTGKYLP